MPGSSVSGGGGGGVSLATVQTEIAKVSPSLLGAGKYYDCDHKRFIFDGLGPSTDSSISDKAYAIPFEIGYEEQDITKISIEVTTAQASSSARLAIYDNDGAGGLPKNLLVDAGIVDTTSTGAKEKTISLTASGLVWLFYACNNNSLAIDCLTFSSGVTDVATGTLGSASNTNDARAQCVRYDFTLGSVGSEASYPSDIESDLVGTVNFDDYPRIRLFI